MPKPPRFPKTDRRLVGTWKSDAARTLAEWKWGKKPSLKAQRSLEALFGKLEISYSRHKVVSVLPDRRWKQSRRYKVLGVDEKSVAIVQYGKLEIEGHEKYWQEGLRMIEKMHSKPVISHIHIQGDYFWILIGDGKNREFFRRVRKK